MGVKKIESTFNHGNNSTEKSSKSEDGKLLSSQYHYNNSDNNPEIAPFHLNTKKLLLTIVFIVFIFKLIIDIILLQFKFADSVTQQIIQITLNVIFIAPVLLYTIIRPLKKQVQLTNDENLRISSKFFQRLNAIDNSTLISITDAKGQFTYTNDLFRKTTGYNEAELANQNHRILKSGVHPPDFYAHLWNTLLSGKQWRGEFCNRKKNGELYWVFSTFSPIFNFEKKIVEFYGIHVDITREKEIEKLQKDEEVKNIFKSNIMAMNQLAAGIGHEINNPLTVIGALVYKVRKLINNSQMTEEEIKKGNTEIAKIDVHIQRILKIIYGMKTFTEIDNKGLLIFYNCENLIEDVLNISRSYYETMGIKITTHIQSYDIYCNPTQIEQALMNIIRNAVQAIENLETEKWIEITTLQKQGFIQISVTDSGNGIPSSIADKILMPFYTTKPAGNGIGLGLTIANNLVTANKGRLYLDNSNAHTRFVVEIPTAPHTELNHLDLDVELATSEHIFWRNELISKLSEKNSTEKLNLLLVEYQHNKNNCYLDRWLTKLSEKTLLTPELTIVENKHKKLHTLAENYVRRSINGDNRANLIDALQPGSNSEFDHLFTDLMLLLNKIK